MNIAEASKKKKPLLAERKCDTKEKWQSLEIFNIISAVPFGMCKVKWKEVVQQTTL